MSNTATQPGFWLSGTFTEAGTFRTYRVRAVWDEAGKFMRSSRDQKNPLRRYRLVKIYG